MERLGSLRQGIQKYKLGNLESNLAMCITSLKKRSKIAQIYIYNKDVY